MQCVVSVWTCISGQSENTGKFWLGACVLLEIHSYTIPITFRYELGCEESKHSCFFCFLNDRGLKMWLPSTIETTDDNLAHRFTGLCANIALAFRALPILEFGGDWSESVQLDTGMSPWIFYAIFFSGSDWCIRFERTLSIHGCETPLVGLIHSWLSSSYEWKGLRH